MTLTRNVRCELIQTFAIKHKDENERSSAKASRQLPGRAGSERIPSVIQNGRLANNNHPRFMHGKVPKIYRF